MKCYTVPWLGGDTGLRDAVGQTFIACLFRSGESVSSHRLRHQCGAGRIARVQCAGPRGHNVHATDATRARAAAKRAWRTPSEKTPADASPAMAGLFPESPMATLRALREVGGLVRRGEATVMCTSVTTLT